jgi:prophage DNA circulation protein
MSYLDRLHKGSFRGAPFFTPAHQMEGGNRGTVHEYPGTDQHTTQVLGRAQKSFSVTAWCLGPDYDLAKNALIQALDQPGPGKLVHRYFGQFDAELDPRQKYRVEESEADGGRAVFTIPFIRASRTTPPNIRADLSQRVEKQAAQARTYARARFIEDTNPMGPEFIRDALLSTLNTVSSSLAAVNRKINGALAITSGVQGAINAISNNAAALVASPLVILTLADNIAAIPAEMFQGIATVGESLTAVRDGFAGTSLESVTAQVESRKLAKLVNASMTELVATDETPEDDSTAYNAQMLANQVAMLQYLRALAAIEAAIASLSLPFDSQDTANELRDALSSTLDALSQQVTDDDVYASLVDLRADVHKHLTQVSGALPSMSEYVPRKALSALLLAHIVHGDARRCEEVIARNNIRHPGFVTAGVPVQVLDA